MNSLKLIRKEVTEDTLEKFEFDVYGYEYLIKNLSDSPIFVSFKTTNDTDEMIKIPANSGQICVISKDTSNIENASKEVYVLCEDDDAEVEVQCIRF